VGIEGELIPFKFSAILVVSQIFCDCNLSQLFVSTPGCNFTFKECISALCLEILKLIRFNSKGVLKQQLVFSVFGKNMFGCFPGVSEDFWAKKYSYFCPQASLHSSRSQIKWFTGYNAVARKRG